MNPSEESHLDSCSWHVFLELGEKIISQPTVIAQRDEIKKTITEIIGCQVNVWLSDVIYHLPGVHDLERYPERPQTPLMEKAVLSKKECYLTKSGQPRVLPKNKIHCSSIAVPLISQGVLVGVVEVHAKPGEEISPIDMDCIKGAASHAAMALYISHRSRINNWRLEQLELVRSVSQQISNIENLEDLSQRVTQSILKTFGFYAVSIFTREKQQNLLTYRATSVQRENGQIEYLTAPIFQVQMDRGIIGRVARTGQEIIANDVEKDPRFIAVDTLPLTKAEGTLPLKIDNEVVGVLDLQSSYASVFHEYDLLVLRSLADNIAMAVEGAKLFNGLQKRVDQIEAVAEVGRAVSSILDLNRLLNELVSLIYDRFGYPFVHLFVMGAEKTSLVYRAGRGERSKALQERGLSYQLGDEQGIIPWVARNSRTMIANDVSKEPIYRPSELPPTVTKSEMAVPIIFGEDVLGVLDVQSNKLDAFDEDDQFIFEALADNVAVAIRNATLYYSEKWRRQVADSLREVAGLLSANLATDRVLNAILTEVERILPCDVSAIWLLSDPNRDSSDEHVKLTLAAVHGIASEELVRVGMEQAQTSDWVGKALMMKEPNIRQPEDPYGPLGAAVHFNSDYSSIAAPLHVGEVPLGVLTLAHHEPGRYGFESRAMTKAFASYAAVAIQNARLYEKAQEQAWVSTVLLQVAEATQSLTDLEELVAAVTRLTPMLVGVKGCAIYLWDDRKKNYSMMGEYGLHEALQHLESSFVGNQAWNSIFEKLEEDGQPVFIYNVDEELRIRQTEDDTGSNPLGSVVIIPMHAHGNQQGIFLIEYDARIQPEGKRDPIMEERLAILQGVAHQTVLAIENIHLLEEQQQETYISASLLQVAQTVVSYNDISDILESIVYLIPVLVGSDACLIYLWNDEKKSFYLSNESGVPKEIQNDLKSKTYSDGECPLFDTIRGDEKPVILPLSAQTGDLLEWLELKPSTQNDSAEIYGENERLIIAFPLAVKGEVYGILLVQDPGNQQIYLQKRIEIIKGIAQQTALAILNDRLQKEMVGRETLEREFDLAREIQQTFLPKKIPEVAGWEFDARWRPARQVGGDFYDLFSLPGHRLGITIADISDKGISAALYMTLTRTLMRAVAQEQRSASMTMVKVNNLLLSDTPHGVFVTALMGILDTQTGLFKYANAGHNLPIIKHDHLQKITTLEKGGMALGVLKNNSYEEHSLQIEAGDMIVFYTDGITDALNNANESFGTERFIRTIEESKTGTATEMLDTIDQTLVAFTESQTPTDDVTMIGLRRLPEN